jgi:V/A-type H+-transporting ATPase subunit I
MIADMARVELICLNSIRNRVVESLQVKGLLQLEEVQTAVDDLPGFLNRVTLPEADQLALSQFEESDRTLREIAPLVTMTPGAHEVNSAAKAVQGWSPETMAEKCRGWAESLRTVTRQRIERQDAIEILNNYRGILQSVAPALGGTGVKLGRGTRAVVLQGNVKRAAARIDQRLGDEIGPDCQFHKNQTGRNRLVGLLSFPESKADAVTRILGQEGVTPVDMREQGFGDATIAEIIERIDRTIAQHQNEIVKHEGEANKVSRQVGAELMAAKGLVADRLARLRVQGQFAQSRMVTVIQGWTPADQYGALQSAVASEFPGEVEVNRIGMGDIPHHEVPTLLRNHEFFKPFELVLGLFKPPTYGTVDPTWMVGLSFTIFYGFILGDAAYGLVIVLLALWIKSKWGKSEIGNAVGTIAMYMGVSSIIFGVIYGEYFGNFVEKTVWPALTGHELHPLFHRAHMSNQLLALAIMFGVFLIPAALVMGVREKLKHGHTKHALEQLGMLLALLGLISFVFGYFGVPLFDSAFMHVVDLVLAIVGAILIFYTMKLMGIVGLIEILSLGGNVLSYARLMALGIASIALADMANMMPGMMGPWFGIPMALLIHVANIGIGIASPTIHSLRLNFVEFLPKFYSAEGRGFNPFRKEAQW